MLPLVSWAVIVRLTPRPGGRGRRWTRSGRGGRGADRDGRRFGRARRAPGAPDGGDHVAVGAQWRPLCRCRRSPRPASRRWDRFPRLFAVSGHVVGDGSRARRRHRAPGQGHRTRRPPATPIESSAWRVSSTLAEAGRRRSSRSRRGRMPPVSMVERHRDDAAGDPGCARASSARLPEKSSGKLTLWQASWLTGRSRRRIAGGENPLRGNPDGPSGRDPERPRPKRRTAPTRGCWRWRNRWGRRLTATLSAVTTIGTGFGFTIRSGSAIGGAPG